MLTEKIATEPLPMSPAERADLEREAGRPFVSDESAHRFRLRKLFAQAVENTLGEKGQ